MSLLFSLSLTAEGRMSYSCLLLSSFDYSVTPSDTFQAYGHGEEIKEGKNIARWAEGGVRGKCVSL